MTALSPHERSAPGFGRPRSPPAADSGDAWEMGLDALEGELRKALYGRAKPCVDEKQTLKLAMRQFDLDNDGRVTYAEFVGALERFGIYSSQFARGLFDRYNENGEATLSFADFSFGLYAPASRKAPYPIKRQLSESRTGSAIEGAFERRESPANNWATSGTELSPALRPVRVHSISNENWKAQAAAGNIPKWERPEGSLNWQTEWPQKR